MTDQRRLNPLTLLLPPLLCYGFVLVWTQNVTQETSVMEDARSPLSPALINVLTGGNISMTLAPKEARSTSPPGGTTTGYSDKQNATDKEDVTDSPLTEDSGTTPLPATSMSPPSLVSDGGIETLTTQACTTRAPLAERHERSTTSGTSGQTSSGVLPGNNGKEVTRPDRASTRVSESAVVGVSAGTPISQVALSTRRDHAGLLKATRGTQADNKMSWRVTIQSSLSREEAFAAFFGKTCDMIFKKALMKNTMIIWGPERLQMMCP
ncbi:serine-rich adhesin for platelets-like [Hyperolius riggenbachi]|uniref:serine-rich adhesin for platelets-like n=1 Tax=Hyperolius riggenbachi TaxID=752182 RepID=UPI0035A3759A